VIRVDADYLLLGMKTATLVAVFILDNFNVISITIAMPVGMGPSSTVVGFRLYQAANRVQVPADPRAWEENWEQHDSCGSSQYATIKSNDAHGRLQAEAE
jgi:hypothetical protein